LLATISKHCQRLPKHTHYLWKDHCHLCSFEIHCISHRSAVDLFSFLRQKCCIVSKYCRSTSMDVLYAYLKSDKDVNGNITRRVFHYPSLLRCELQNHWLHFSRKMCVLFVEPTAPCNPASFISVK
jgi:hypothetical protein